MNQNVSSPVRSTKKGKRLPLRLIALFLITIVLFYLPACAETVPAPNENSLKVTFIDVGKGDCILIQKGNSAVLIDTGYDATSTTVLYYLQEHGIEALDCMIITHYDKDHVGGAAYLAENLEIKKILLPGYEGESKFYSSLMDVIAKNGIPAQMITSDLSFALEDINYTVFAPNVGYKAGEDGKEGNDNDCSLVIAVTYLEDSYLFAGDIEKAGIKAFLKAHTGKCDVLKLPHHGSLEKNTEDLLEATEPRIAVITDSTGEPASSDLLVSLKSDGITCYRSSVNGNITVTSKGDGEYSISTEK